MLFYIKRHISLEISVTALLGALGYWGIQSMQLPIALIPSKEALVVGVVGAIWLTLWTFVPMIAHGLFDIGGMIYFRGFMERQEKMA